MILNFCVWGCSNSSDDICVNLNLRMQETQFYITSVKLNLSLGIQFQKTFTIQELHIFLTDLVLENWNILTPFENTEERHQYITVDFVLHLLNYLIYHTLAKRSKDKKKVSV